MSQELTFHKHSLLVNTLFNKDILVLQTAQFVTAPKRNTTSSKTLFI